LDPELLVSIDETRAKWNSTRLRGRLLKGTRTVARVLHGHWKPTTFVAALRISGITVPMLVDGAINVPIFLASVQRQPVLTLTSGDIVVMNNLGAHNVAGVKAVIHVVGARRNDGPDAALQSRSESD
jgi:hypothetical protein